jgi:hypothetical protein
VTRARKKKSQKRKSSTIIFDYACARVPETGDSREKKFVFAQSPENGDSAKNERFVTKTLGLQNLRNFLIWFTTSSTITSKPLGCFLAFIAKETQRKDQGIKQKSGTTPL